MFRKFVVLFALAIVVQSANASVVPIDWRSASSPATFDLVSGLLVTSGPGDLFNTGAGDTLIGHGQVADFTLAIGETINAMFMSADGTTKYSALGVINTVTLVPLGGFTFAGLTSTGEILGGSFSITPGSSSLDLYGATLDVTTVPVPAAVWLFGSALIGLFGANRKMTA
jgi:hypothetical protein